MLAEIGLQLRVDRTIQSCDHLSLLACIVRLSPFLYPVKQQYLLLTRASDSNAKLICGFLFIVRKKEVLMISCLMSSYSCWNPES